MDALFFQNSLAWVHYRLRGGLRSMIVQGAGFFFIVGGLILASVRANPLDVDQTLYGWTIGLLTLQVGILVLYGSAAVRNSVRRDFTTGMIASHRLMPISGSQAVTGYVLGSCPQPLAVAAANLLLGMLIVGPAHVSPTDWLAANAVLLLFAVCSWVVVTCAALVSPKSAAAVLIAVVLVAMSGGLLLTTVPAFTVICSPLVGSTIFGIVMKGAAWSDVLHVSIMAQAAVTALFFVAAARKYRRDDISAIGPLLGMVTVAFFVAISVFGIRRWTSLQPMVSNITGQVRQLQVIGSLAAGLIVSFLPIAAAAWDQEEYRRRRLLSDPALGRRKVSTVLLAVVSGCTMVAIPAFTVPRAELNGERVLGTLVCLVAALVPVAYLLRLAYRTRSGIGIVISLWIVLSWIVPWLVSFAILIAHGIEDASRLPVAWSRSEWIASFSPIGALVSIWTGRSEAYLPAESPPYAAGVVFQVVVAITMTTIYYWRSQNREVRVPVS